MKYKNFELDDFQIDAIKHIDENKSVVVSVCFYEEKRFERIKK